MGQRINGNQVKENDDNVPSVRAVANVGKRFYTWATLGTFAGASFLVSGLWALLKRLNISNCNSEVWPLVFSFIVIIAFAFASEPEHKTYIHQKVQKGLLTIGNALLVYFAVVGATGVVSAIAAT
ncbi:MAG: hypothetical protein ACFFH0_11565 [Promethearchaeota archaeon]